MNNPLKYNDPSGYYVAPNDPSLFGRDINTFGGPDFSGESSSHGGGGGGAYDAPKGHWEPAIAYKTVKGRTGYGNADVSTYSVEYFTQKINTEMWVSDPAGQGVFDKISSSIGISGMGMEALSYAAKNSAAYTPKYAYQGMAQAEAAAAKLLGNIAKVTRIAGTTASALTTGYSTYKVGTQYYIGGVQNINVWDVTDATVGGLGLYAGYAISVGIASGPIGWGTILIGATVYGVGRSAYEFYNEP